MTKQARTNADGIPTACETLCTKRRNTLGGVSDERFIPPLRVMRHTRKSTAEAPRTARFSRASQRVDDDRHVDRLLERRADHRRQHAERGDDHEQAAQAEADANALP